MIDQIQEDSLKEPANLTGRDLLDFFIAERERGVTVTAIARRMSISRQGLYQRIESAKQIAAAHDAA